MSFRRSPSAASIACQNWISVAARAVWLMPKVPTLSTAATESERNSGFKLIDLSPDGRCANANRAILFVFDDSPASPPGRRTLFTLLTGAGCRNLTSHVTKLK
ncbi:MAG: hypothetical protein PPHEINF_2651 [uncultured Paraburkholderia sp.]|nr:MAG: hypothetical protein PPHEINF_2651 [uncultured Paraburkholderia sp.]